MRFAVTYKLEDNEPCRETIFANSQDEAKEKFLNKHKQVAFWIDIVSIEEI